jgi:exodeoxyribonuclease VII small subunit
MSEAAPIDEMTFEQAMAELEQVVERLEKGEVPLEESIGLYERGARLKAHCEAKLKAAEERVERLTLDARGEPRGTQPFDTQ